MDVSSESRPQQAERFFLSKASDGKDIYVDLPTNVNLEQHQIEGVRFLYRQYEKKKPMIFNDPSGYGKCLQIILFLKAIRPMMTYPVLIITENEEKAQNWLTHFETYTDYSQNELLGYKKHLSPKHLFYVHTLASLPMPQFTASRRRWTMVLVHDDSFAARTVLLDLFENYFKIWVTCIDMKEHLAKFAGVYEWLFPMVKLHADSYAPRGSRAERLERAMLLDAFMKDVVLRRQCFMRPFKTPRVSIKNKDPTGTKVKRSKPKPPEETKTTEPTKLESKPSTIVSAPEESIEMKEVQKEPDRAEPMDIESFINQQQPITADELPEIDDSDDENKQNITNFNQPDTGVHTLDNLTDRQVASEIKELILHVKAEEKEFDQDAIDTGKPNGILTDTAVVDVRNNDIEMKENEREKEASIKNAGTTTTHLIAEVTTNVVKSEYVLNCNDGLKSNENNNGKGANVQESVPNTKKSRRHSDVDDTISEIEERILKKFKGSVLDSIF